MLQQAIATTRALADQIGVASAASPTIAQTQSDVAGFVNGPLQTLDQLSAEVIGFANDALGQLATLLAVPMVDVPAMTVELNAFRQSSQQFQGDVAPAIQAMNGAVAKFSGDAGTLQAAATAINAQIAALTAQRDAAKADADKIAERIKWIDGFSVVLPILKLADELASLITSQKTVEQQLTDAQNKLDAVQDLSNALTRVMQLSQSLSTVVGQLASATQSLANATNLVASELTTQIQSSTPAQAKVLALSLEGSLKSVVALAS